MWPVPILALGDTSSRGLSLDDTDLHCSEFCIPVLSAVRVPRPANGRELENST